MAVLAVLAGILQLALHGFYLLVRLAVNIVRSLFNASLY